MTNIIFPNLSYKIVGACFYVHNAMGRYLKEKQYCDALAKMFSLIGIAFCREFLIPGTMDRVDFLIEEKIVLEAKAKPIIRATDYYQVQRYLQLADKKLGLIVNFRSRYLKPWRIIKVDPSRNTTTSRHSLYSN